MSRTSLRFRALAVGVVVPTLLVGLVGAAPAQADPDPAPSTAPAVAEVPAEAAPVVPEPVTPDAPAVKTPAPAEDPPVPAVTTQPTTDEAPAQTASKAPVVAKAAIAAAAESPVLLDTGFSGTPMVGSQVRAEVYGLDPTNAMLSFKWEITKDGITRDATGPGADTDVYTPVGADGNGVLTATITASADGFSDGTATTSDTVLLGSQMFGGPTFTGDDPPRVGTPITVDYPDYNVPGHQITYRWASIDANFTGDWQDIPGATQASYTPTEDVRGKHLALFTVFTAEGYHEEGEGRYVGYVDAAPLGVTVTGTPQLGQTLTATTTSVPAGQGVSYQWQAADKNADDPSFQDIRYGKTLDLDDPSLIGKTIRIKVLLVQTGGEAFSDEVGPVTTGVLNVGTYTVDGSYAVGNTLTVTGDNPADADTTYQWFTYADDIGDRTVIEDATDSTYTLKAADQGKRVGVRVVNTKTGYEDATQTIAGEVVDLGTFDSVPDGSMSGDPVVDHQVTVELSGSSHPEASSVTYQWLTGEADDMKAVDEANGASFTPGAGLAGKHLSVKVTFSKDGYKDASLTFDLGEVGKADLKDYNAPTMTGKFQVGETVTAVADPADEGVSVSYQWYRVLGDETDEVIDGEDEASYTLTEADQTRGQVAMGVRVYVTYVKDGYTSQVVPSATMSVSGKAVDNSDGSGDGSGDGTGNSGTGNSKGNGKMAGTGNGAQSLPDTGADLPQGVLAGAALSVLLGLGLVVAGRRRKGDLTV